MDFFSFTVFVLLKVSGFYGGQPSLGDILVWRLSAKNHKNLVRTRTLPDRVKRSPFMLHPLLQTHRPLECTLGKSCQKKVQKQPLIRAVTVIIIIALLKLMKNYIRIYP